MKNARISNLQLLSLCFFYKISRMLLLLAMFI